MFPKLLLVTTTMAAGILLAAPGFSLPLILELDGEIENDQFGIAVAGGGNLNGDAFDDVVVGASASDAGGDGSGQVYIFFGSAEPDAIADLQIIGDAGELLGNSVSMAGDVNDDGFDDLIVGAQRSGAGGSFSGRVLIFLGGNPMDGIADLELVGPAAEGYFGRSVSGGVDLNGDGYDDVIVGADRIGGGQAFVFFGGDPMDDVPDLTLDAGGASDRFGSVVAMTADLNGDDDPDFFVGAPRNSDAGVWAGKGYLYHGGPGMDATPDLTVTGEAAGDFFAMSAHGGGDLDGDGEADLVVGAPYHNVGNSPDAGKAYLYLGGPGIDATADQVYEGGSTEEELGRSVALVASVNGDALADLVIGAPGADDGGAGSGRVDLYHGAAQPGATPDETFPGAGAGDAFGIAVDDGGDLNANQSGALVAGAWNHALHGAAYVYGDDTPGTGVEDAGTPGAGRAHVRIFPNPGADLFHIDVAASSGNRMQALGIYDAFGRLVVQLRPQSGLNRLQLQWDGKDHRGRSVPAGTYFFGLEGERDAPRWKITVQR